MSWLVPPSVLAEIVKMVSSGEITRETGRWLTTVFIIHVLYWRTQ